MSYKIAYSIKKYNQDTKKTSFYKDVSEIFSQNYENVNNVVNYNC